MQKDFVCIICPNSCPLSVANGGVSGAKCKRGISWALQEAECPQRVITTTVACSTAQGTIRIPVKTSKPVPLRNIQEAMKRIQKIILSEKPCLGQEVTSEYLTGISLIVTGE